ncbi:MAG: HAMP domain-containing histidine kinase [Bacteroidales bacterium]|jgi:two-component system sensor histidine kinase/response regulator|nr:HAMP domain-containing histidine kinase [Bacteroidales bacterium]
MSEYYQSIALSILLSVLLLLAIIQHFQRRKMIRYHHRLLSKINHDCDDLNLLIDELKLLSEKRRQLTEDNLATEKSNSVKDRLLSIISHDLRSPMSSLQALLNLFNTNSIASKDLIEFFGKLLFRVENTTAMLENLLHWSQFQLGGIEPIYCKTNIQEVIDDSINFYRMQAEQKRIVIERPTDIPLMVQADVEMLKIILRNLLSNALKFTCEGGAITVNTSQEDDYAVVSVKDTGVGISQENQKKMFSMSSFTTMGTGKEKGAGLGLLLCKDFVEHNRGKLWLDSREGAGSTFYFSIPLAETKEKQKTSCNIA